MQVGTDIVVRMFGKWRHCVLEVRWSQQISSRHSLQTHAQHAVKSVAQDNLYSKEDYLGIIIIIICFDLCCRLSIYVWWSKMYTFSKARYSWYRQKFVSISSYDFSLSLDCMRVHWLAYSMFDARGIYKESPERGQEEMQTLKHLISSIVWWYNLPTHSCRKLT